MDQTIEDFQAMLEDRDTDQLIDLCVIHEVDPPADASDDDLRALLVAKVFPDTQGDDESDQGDQQEAEQQEGERERAPRAATNAEKLEGLEPDDQVLVTCTAMPAEEMTLYLNGRAVGTVVRGKQCQIPVKAIAVLDDAIGINYDLEV